MIHYIYIYIYEFDSTSNYTYLYLSSQNPTNHHGVGPKDGTLTVTSGGSREDCGSARLLSSCTRLSGRGSHDASVRGLSGGYFILIIEFVRE